MEPGHAESHSGTGCCAQPVGPGPGHRSTSMAHSQGRFRPVGALCVAFEGSHLSSCQLMGLRLCLSCFFRQQPALLVLHTGRLAQHIVRSSHSHKQSYSGAHPGADTVCQLLRPFRLSRSCRHFCTSNPWVQNYVWECLGALLQESEAGPGTKVVCGCTGFTLNTL